MSIECPNCGRSFEIIPHYSRRTKRYTCPYCGDQFYSIGTLRSMGKRGLKRAFRYLECKPYFKRVYGHLLSTWGLSEEAESHE
jgi:transposase-like protein